MNAVQLLKQQHQDVRELFALFEKARDNTDKDRICQQLANNLAAHMIIEERIFYPAAFEAMKNESLQEESLSEHQEAKDLLAEILDMDMSLGGEQFDEKMRLLEQKIEHHVQEEENEVFKQVKEVMDKDELKRLGEEMKILFTEEMAGEPSERLMRGESSDSDESDESDESDDDEASTEETSQTSRL